MNLTKKKSTIIIFAAVILVLSLIVTTLTLSGYFMSPGQESQGSACAHFEAPNRTIVVTCDSTISEISNTIANDDVLKKGSGEGEWLLNSSVVVLKGAVLTINEPEARWIKINSQGRSHDVKEVLSSTGDAIQSTPYIIQVFGGLDLKGVKITSWNPVSNNYTFQKADGTVLRPYVTIEENADPSHISGSEIAFLGYNSSRKQGLSYYGGDGSTLTGNQIHDLWYGFYSTKVGHILIDNNSIYDNLKYGIDPHTGSHDISVRNNQIYNSRIGLICSLSCSNLLFENNRIENNKEVGVMFSKNTVNSTARFNNISSSDTGISISESHSNKVHNNNVSNTSDGIAVKNNSTGNMIINNVISTPTDCGVLITLASRDNSVGLNYVQKYSQSGICLSNAATHNLIYSNIIDGLGQYGIDVKDHDAIMNNFTNNTIQLSNNAIRLYDNTGTLFVSNKVGNSQGHQYIVSGNANLTLLKTQFIGDRIRSAGTLSNTVTIFNSGTVDVVTERAGTNDTTQQYNTDIKPYVAKLTSATVRLYSR
jgi:parallel beta-helix repeat protein